MASVFPQSQAALPLLAMPSGRELSRGMSRHAAAAMLLFTGWQIWLAVALSNLPGGAAMPWVALTLLIIGAIPFARRIERRWQRLTVNALPCPGLLTAYRRDRGRLWLAAVALPPLAMLATLGIAQLT
jgi:MprA protease rhombosortase-interaction domain-containing protein